MERRLQKGFQIGFVEGIITEVIGANKEPRDVFSKIAQAIGHQASSRKKKDWNAMVRCNTMVRDPIGSSSEADFRHSRQSMKKRTTGDYNTDSLSMDAEKLMEYNQKLSLVKPATRVAYTKFKAAKLRQEFNDMNNKSDENAIKNNGDTSITDVAFHTKETYNCHPKNEASQRDATKSTSTVRCINKSESPCAGLSALHSSTAIDQLLPEAPSSLTEMKPDNTAKSPVNDDTQTSQVLNTSFSAVRKDTRMKTPIQEEDEEESMDNSQWQTRMKEEEEEEAESSKEIKTEILKPVTTTETMTSMKSPVKRSGKSKLTGEIITGWI
jgi:transient receptor potential cation channel subfamily C